MTIAFLVPIVLSGVLASPVPGGEAKPALTLTPCNLPGLQEKARCGKLSVFEDRAAGRGRKIDL
jgi:hypothetical protein